MKYNFKTPDFYNSFDTEKIPSIPGVEMVASQIDVDNNNKAIEEAYKKVNTPVSLQTGLFGVPLSNVYYIGNYLDYTKMLVMADLGVNVLFYWQSGAGAGIGTNSKPGNGAVETIWKNSVAPYLKANYIQIWDKWLSEYHAFLKNNTKSLSSFAKNMIEGSRKLFSELAKNITGYDISSLFKPLQYTDDAATNGNKNNSVIIIFVIIIIVLGIGFAVYYNKKSK